MNAKMLEMCRDSDGTLASFAWPGGYPLVYICGDRGTLCPDCANMAEAEGLADDPHDPQWFLVAGFMHLEGAPETCDHCGDEIESAYGDPQNPNTHTHTTRRDRDEHVQR